MWQKQPEFYRISYEIDFVIQYKIYRSAYQIPADQSVPDYLAEQLRIPLDCEYVKTNNNAVTWAHKSKSQLWEK